MFGSHLTYSWPRYFEEIARCLTDNTPPEEALCNDDGECETAWEACSIGQGASLHEVGHAFGAPHTTGIMARGYAQEWPKNFLSQTAYCAKNKSDGISVIDGEFENNARGDLKKLYPLGVSHNSVTQEIGPWKSATRFLLSVHGSKMRV